MADTPRRGLRLTGDRVDALAALAYAHGTDDKTEIVAAMRGRLERARAGLLPPGHTAKVICQYRILGEVWDPLRELAASRHTSITDEVEAAIDDYVAAAQEPSQPAERLPRKRKPRAAQAGEAVPDSAGPDAGMCPPHPPARVIKGFCGACGQPV